MGLSDVNGVDPWARPSSWGNRLAVPLLVTPVANEAPINIFGTIVGGRDATDSPRDRELEL